MLEKAATDITGFDELTGGGLPRGRVTLVEVGAAIVTAKKTFPDQVSPETDLDFMEFMVDSAIRLRHEVIEGVSQRTLRDLKYRCL